MIKITDVAREAGVSPSTVSHVLSGNRPISQKTRDKVLEVIDRLGYEPNTNARALKSKYSGIIGFFASDITELFVNKIIRGVEKVTGEKGQHLLFASGVEFDFDLHKALQFLQRRNIDGIIVSYEITRKFEPLDLKDIKLPIVTINRNLSDSIPSVLPDNFEGGRTAASHLLAQGTRHPAVVAGPRDRRASVERLEGFLEGIRERGRTVEGIPVSYSRFNFESGFSAARELFASHPETDAVFCGNDYIAAGVIDYARRHKIDVPERVRVIGYDDRDFASFWPTPISTFSQPLELMGETSARLLHDLIREKGDAPARTLLKSDLIVRHSSDPSK